ncbi:MAG TPA: class I SAM-dependent rRNA methyltransferase [Roseiflexaceae bacterium]|nr:class I SAM-dependent rRNA methyltransferase [Roseiflexaceae bacterium]
MSKLPEIQLPTQLKERLAHGHPWVYRNHVPPNVRLPSGAWVRARCGSWSGYGLWDAERPIAIRIFSDRQPPDARWLRERVRAAWELRGPLREAGCTAYRWLFGEGDGLPGLTVDRYGDFAVLQTYMDGAGQLVDWLIDALNGVAPLRGIVIKTHEPSDASELPGSSERDEDEGRRTKDEGQQSQRGRLSSVIGRRPSDTWGAAPPTNLVVREHGIQFFADLRGGQKTGLFLDHRENRRFVEGLSAGRTVLNCFAYTGAFSLYALRGGARSVVSADIGKGLAEAAAANVDLNGFDAARHSFATADCFELLNQYADQGRQFDLVILDPPSFAKSKQNRHAAVRAYTRLNALALRCVAPGGLLATASCTSQIGPEAFKEMLAAAGASAGKRLQIIHEAGQPLDHPVPAAFPEGRYLKFVVGRAGDVV